MSEKRVQLGVEVTLEVDLDQREDSVEVFDGDTWVAKVVVEISRGAYGYFYRDGMSLQPLSIGGVTTIERGELQTTVSIFQCTWETWQWSVIAFQATVTVTRRKEETK